MAAWRMTKVFFIVVLALAIKVGINNKTCGIIGGDDTAKSEYPFMVNILKFDITAAAHFVHHCAGTILDNNRILTAAHCLEYVVKLDEFYVIAADYDQTINEKTETRHTINSIDIHPSYNSSTSSFDAAILYITPSLVFGDKIKPVLLPPSNFIQKGNTIVLGWGSTDIAAPFSKRLQKANLTVMDTATCKKQYFRSNQMIDSSMFCAFHSKSSLCFGDSGGPALCRNGVRNVQCGIVSAGSKDCDGGEKFPNVLVNVSSIVEWIFPNGQPAEYAASGTTLPGIHHLVMFLFPFVHYGRCFAKTN